MQRSLRIGHKPLKKWVTRCKLSSNSLKIPSMILIIHKKEARVKKSNISTNKKQFGRS